MKTTREKLYQWLGLLINVKSYYKTNGLYKGVFFIGFFNLPGKGTSRKLLY